MTATGERPVESLKAGDLVLTRTNGRVWVSPIARIAQQRPGTRSGSGARPLIMIPAHAISGGIPIRNLRVGPDQPLCIDGMNVLAASLLSNAAVQEAPASEMTVFEIILEQPGMVVADGVWSECAGVGSPQSVPLPD